MLMKDKPKILAIDYLEKRYAGTKDIMDIMLMQSIPKNVDGFSGVVIHNPEGIDHYILLIEECIRKDLPLIFQGVFLMAVRDRIEGVYNSYPKAYYTHSDYELASTLKEIFGQKFYM